MKFVRFVLRNALRRPLRTGLTALSVAGSIVVFGSLLALDHGVTRMIETTGDDLVITVFERYKACPPYSNLPVSYRERIAAIPHVKRVMPVRFLLSNCQTTTDLVAVHGVEAATLREFRRLDVEESAYQAFARERGAALVGRAVAEKYGWKPGDAVTLKELGGVSFTVRGVFDAPGSSLQSVVLVDREYLEYATKKVGIATMFVVLVDGPQHVDSVSHQIDAEFENASTQTKSGPEKAFIAGSIEDFRSMVKFSQVVAYLALLLLLAAVANSMSMSVRDRVREIAVLRTLGFRRARIVRMVLLESATVSALAAGLGFAVVAFVLRGGRFSISVEGYTIFLHPSWAIGAFSLGLGVLLGLLGAYLPARGAARRPLTAALREVA